MDRVDDWGRQAGLQRSPGSVGIVVAPCLHSFSWNGMGMIKGFRKTAQFVSIAVGLSNDPTTVIVIFLRLYSGLIMSHIFLESTSHCQLVNKLGYLPMNWHTSEGQKTFNLGGGGINLQMISSGLVVDLRAAFNCCLNLQIPDSKFACKKIHIKYLSTKNYKFWFCGFYCLRH